MIILIGKQLHGSNAVYDDSIARDSMLTSSKRYLSIINFSRRRNAVADVNVRLAIQGNGVVPYPVPEGTTVAQLRELMQLNPSLEIRIGGNVVSDEAVIDDGDLVIGTQPVKGGIA